MKHNKHTDTALAIDANLLPSAKEVESYYSYGMPQATFT
jgi:hypothetical protein